MTSLGKMKPPQLIISTPASMTSLDIAAWSWYSNLEYQDHTAITKDVYLEVCILGYSVGLGLVCILGYSHVVWYSKYASLDIGLGLLCILGYSYTFVWPQGVNTFAMLGQGPVKHLVFDRHTPHVMVYMCMMCVTGVISNSLHPVIPV